MKLPIAFFIVFILYSNIHLIKSQQISILTKRIKTQLRKLNSRENLRDYLNNGGIFDCDNTYCTQISFLNSQYLDNQVQKFPQIFPGNTDSSKVVVKIFKKHKFPENSNNYNAGINAIADIVYFQLYNFINNIIDSDPIILTSYGKNELMVYLPLYLSENLKNKVISVSGQNPSNDIKDILNYDIFYPSSKMYTDICYTLTYSILPEDIYSKESIQNLDITLEQRKKYYFPGNVQLCPKSCSYKGIDKATLSSICQCNLVYLESVEHDEYIFFDFNEKNFYDKRKDNYFSMDTLKCLKHAKVKHNYGFAFFIIILIVMVFCFVLLFLFGVNEINKAFDLFIGEGKEKNKITISPFSNKEFEENGLNFQKKNKREDSAEIRVMDIQNNENEQIKENEENNKKNNGLALNINKKNNDNKLKPTNAYGLEENKTDIDKINNETNKGNKNVHIGIMDIQNSESGKRILPNADNGTNANEEKEDYNKKIVSLLFTEQEINSMNFENCLKYDKRETFFGIYLSFINRKQPLIFLLNYYPRKEEEKFRIKLTPLKYILFCYEMLIYIFIYSSFFGSKSVSKIYFGTFNFGKKCAIGSVIALFAIIIRSVIYFFIYYFTLYDQIVQAKIKLKDKLTSEENNSIEEKKENIKKEIIEPMLKFLKIRLIIFAGVTILVLIFVSFLVTSFCYVYNNSQAEIFLSFLVSILFANIYAFIICLIPTSFRYAWKNLSDKEPKDNWLFKAYYYSKII